MRSKLEIAMEAMRTLSEFSSSDDPAMDKLAVLFYTPDDRLGSFFVELECLQSRAENSKDRRESQELRQRSGYLMESIAILAFRSLQGWSELKSYQSAGPQHDLVIDGASLEWQALCRYLKMNSSTRQGIVVETKAIGSRLADHEFARLCAVIDYNLMHAGLGIFFTLKGASGFPKDFRRASRSLRDSRMRQVIYYAKSSIPIVVFDHSDLRQLTSSGSLPILIRRKVKEVADLTGLPTSPVQAWREVLLPDYLKVLMERS